MVLDIVADEETDVVGTRGVAKKTTTPAAITIKITITAAAVLPIALTDANGRTLQKRALGVLINLFFVFLF